MDFRPVCQLAEITAVAQHAAVWVGFYVNSRKSAFRESIWRDVLVLLEVEPALSALECWVAVPSDRQRPQPAVQKFDQLLLQRIDAKGIFVLEDIALSVGSVVLDDPRLAEDCYIPSTPPN